MNRRFFTVVAIIHGLALGTPAIAQQPANSPAGANVAVDRSPLPPNTGIISSFAPIVSTIAPSVVSIYTTKTVKVPREMREFFGGMRSGEIQGLGSGVIVSDDGYILTNSHLAEGADEIMVSLGLDHKEYKAKKIGVDSATDLAVLKIDAKSLPAVTFADSDKARVGDIVLAVGTPYGLTQTVTMGIISGLGRGGIGITDYEDFIQTDASINPGNSGGALVDTQGRLVGINTAIYSPNGGNNGIGFAIPANLAHEILKDIRDHGSVVRGYIGAIVQPVTQELADTFKLNDVAGALVSEVTSGGPAEKSGIKNGDVITQVNDRKINDSRDLRLLISRMTPGTKVDVKYIRDKQEKTAQIELGMLPKKAAQIPSTDEEETQESAHTGNILDGLSVSDLDRNLREMFHIPAKVDGVLISGVDRDSAAYRAGLREGYVIESVNRQPARHADEVAKLGTQIKKGDKLLMEVWGRGHNAYVALGDQ